MSGKEHSQGEECKNETSLLRISFAGVLAWRPWPLSLINNSRSFGKHMPGCQSLSYLKHETSDTTRRSNRFLVSVSVCVSDGFILLKTFERTCRRRWLHDEDTTSSSSSTVGSMNRCVSSTPGNELCIFTTLFTLRGNRAGCLDGFSTIGVPTA